jgi:DNA recombination protein RmuC
MDYVFLAIGLLLGALVTWLLMKGKLALAEANGHTAGEVECTRLAEQLKAASQELSGCQARLTSAEETVTDVQADLSNLREVNGGLTADVVAKKERLGKLETVQQELSTANATIAGMNATLKQERVQTGEKLALLTSAREALSNQFKALANEILDDKSKKFTDLNKTNLSQLLDPLKEKIIAFQTKVEEVYINESKDRSALAAQVNTITQLNAT